MDLVALIGDSSDDDDDGSNGGYCCGTEEGEDYESIEKKTAKKAAGSGRNKLRRRGSIDVIQSSEAQHSDFFSRSVPHRRGHWAGHIKISVPMIPSSSPSSSEISLRKWKKRSVKRFQQLLELKGISGTIVEHDILYTSLSKHFSLQVSQIESFTRRLADLVRQEHSMNLYIEPTSRTGDDDIDQMVLMNEGKTRSFWCWKVHPNATLLRLVAHVDAVLKIYNQPTYYRPARFHVSVASFPGNILEKSVGNDEMTSMDRSHCRRKAENRSSSPPIDTTMMTTNNSRADISNDIRNDIGNDIGNDSDGSSSSSSSFDDSVIVPVHELLCTFGTTKKFIFKLRNES